MPVIFLTYYNTHNLNNLQKELEIINPLLHNMTDKLGVSGQISLTDKNILKDYGDYYLIFRNCLGIKFYIHNTITILISLIGTYI